MNNRKETKTLLINTLFIAFGNLGAKLISFLLLPLYTSLLSTSSYGVYDFIITISSFLSPMISLCLSESLFRFLIESKNDEKKIKNVISSSLKIITINIAIYIIISSIIYCCVRIDYIPILTIYVISNIIYLYMIALLRGLNKMKAYAIYSGIKNALQVLFCCCAIVVLGLGINGLLYGTIISSIGISLIIFINLKIWKYISVKNKNNTLTKRMIKYSLPLIPDSLSGTILSMSDRIVVKSYLGSSQNGVYSVAHKFPSIIEVLYHFFLTAWNESASRVYENNKDKAADYYQSLYEFTQKILIGGVICLIAGMHILFKLLIRGDFTDSYIYVPFLIIAQLFNSIAQFYSGILIANKDTKKIANSTIISAIINIALNVILVIPFKIYGILIATIIANIVLLILRKINSNKYVKLRENIPYLIVSILIYALVLLLYNNNNIFVYLFNIIITLAFFIISNLKPIKIIVLGVKNKLANRS